MSSLRREGREAAVQFLYSLDQNPAPDASGLELFWTVHQAGPGARKFAESLIGGVIARRREVDERLTQALSNWALDRLEVVDRNVLRLAIYEMFFCLETPPIVMWAVARTRTCTHHKRTHASTHARVNAPKRTHAPARTHPPSLQV